MNLEAFMAEKVNCIVRGDKNKYSDCRCITEIRTEAARYNRQQAHDKVKASPGSIYVEAGGSKANLVPAEREGLKYVRTAPNDTTTDNLLKVRDC
jgi:acetylornithine deacetylase/succinyl-diaminopimelate desuccinylase-like protein